MKKIIVYILLGLVFFFFAKFFIRVIFTPSKQTPTKQTNLTPTPIPTQTADRNNDKFVANLQVAVYNDRDDNAIRGFSEKGLDWLVFYRLDNQPTVHEIKTQADKKCFPTIFNWLYGGCSQVIELQPGHWIKIWLADKKGWKINRQPTEFQLKTGQNMVMFGVRRYRPEEIETKPTVNINCRNLKIKLLQEDSQTSIVEADVVADSGEDNKNLQYRMVVDNQDSGWHRTNTFKLRLAKNKSHKLQAYIKDSQGNVVGGQNSCQQQIGLNMKTQPKTGTPIILLFIGLIVSPVAAIFLLKKSKVL